MTRFLPSGIRERLLSLIALVLIPMLLLIGWIYRERYETRRIQAVQTELEVAQGIATTFAAFVADIRRQNHALGEVMVSLTPMEPEAKRLLAFNADQYRAVRNLSWVSPRGIVLASSDEALIGSDLSDRSYFQEIKAGRPWSIGELTRRGKVAPLPTFAIATAIRDKGTLEGIMVAGMEPSTLDKAVFPLSRPSEGTFSIFDNVGSVVYRGPGQELPWEDRVRWRQRDPLLRRAIGTGNSQTGIVDLGMQSGEWISARVPIPETGWVAGAGRPARVALAPVRETLLYDAAVAGLIASAAFLLAWVVARSIARPIQRLEGDAEMMGSGQVRLREDPAAPEEILRLRGTVTEMATHLLDRADALRQSEERFRTLFSTMTEAFALGEPILNDEGEPRDFRFLEINDAFVAQTGLPPTIVGQPASVVLPQLEPVWIETYGAVALGGEAVRFEQYNRDTDRWYDVYCYRPAEGRFAILFRDVTENRRMQESLRQSEAEFRQLAETLPQLVWVTRPDGYHEYFNQLWYDYTGTTPEETQGELWSHLLHPDDYRRTLEHWHHCLETGQPYSIEYRFRRARHGDYRWFLGRATPLRNEAGEIVKWFGTCTEIHEQILARQALARQAEELHALAQEKGRTAAMLDSMLQHAPAGFAFFDREHRYVRVNDFLCRINGLPAEDHLGRPIREVLPENARLVDPILERVFEEGVSVENIEIEGETPLHPGKTRHWLTGWYPVPLPEGQEPLVGVVVLEITGQKRLERSLRDTQAELLSINETLEERVEERTAELSAVNRELEAFTYTVSHDLRAPLRHVTSFVQLLGARYGGDLDEQGKRYLKIIAEAGRRMGNLIDDLLAFSRLGRAALNRAPVDLRRMTEEVRRELAPEAAGRRIEWKLGDLPRVQADPVLLRTVVTNLLSNALKYTRHRDPAKIEINCKNNENELIYCVCDNGAGFDMRYAGKLFGVFQRLHRDEEFEGTGIGLASVRRIIERHGGRTWAEGEVDRGATFYFSLPASASDENSSDQDN